MRIVASGICHTDIDICDNWDSADTPVVLGHEGAGVVEQVGKRVKGVTRDDHVVLSYQSCGRCRQCRTWTSDGLRALLGVELWFRTPGRQQCHATQRRSWAFLWSVFLRHPRSCHQTQPRQGSQRLTSGDVSSAGLRHANRSRHRDELVEGSRRGQASPSSVRERSALPRLWRLASSGPTRL